MKKKFTFIIPGIRLTAPSEWHKAPLLKRLIYPIQPELFGIGNEYIGFEKPQPYKEGMGISDLADNLTRHAKLRGNRIISTSSIEFQGKKYPTIILERAVAGYETTKMKKYSIVLGNRYWNIVAGLSSGGTEFYSEKGYDEVIQSIQKWRGFF